MRIPIRRNTKRGRASSSSSSDCSTSAKSEATRRMIVAAARRIFARNSYRAASFRMIAREGGFSFTLINHYFTKAELFEAVSAQVMEELAMASVVWLEGLERKSPEPGLSLFLERALDYLFDTPDAVMILMQNVAQTDKSGEIPGFDRFSSYVTDARKMISQVIPGNDDPDQVIMWIYGLINLLVNFVGASAYHGKVLGVDPQSPLYRKWIKDTVMYLFLPPLKAMASAR